MASNFTVTFNATNQTPTPFLMPTLYDTTYASLGFGSFVSTPDGSTMYYSTKKTVSGNLTYVVWESINYGYTWTTKTTLTRFPDVMSNNGVALAAAADGTYRSTNFGVSYTKVSGASIPSVLNSASAINSNGAYQVIGFESSPGVWRATSVSGTFTKILTLSTNVNDVINSIIVSDDGLKIAVCVYNGIYISSVGTIGTTPVFTKISGPGGTGNPSTVDYHDIAPTSDFSKIVVINERWICWCNFSSSATMVRFALPDLGYTGWIRIKVISTDGSTNIMALTLEFQLYTSNNGVYLSSNNCTTTTKITNSIINPYDGEYWSWLVGAFIPSRQSIIIYASSPFNSTSPANNYMYTYNPITITGSFDLSTMFKVKGVPTAAVTGYKVNDADLNTKYAPLSDGVSIGHDTGYDVNGADLSTIFASL